MTAGDDRSEASTDASSKATLPDRTEGQGGKEPGDGTSPPSLSNDTVNRRRHLLDQSLREHKQARLKKKLPADAQFLALAREDLGLKRQLLSDMNDAEKRYSANFAALSQTLGQLSQTMDQGFGMLSGLLAISNASTAALPTTMYRQMFKPPSQPWSRPVMPNASSSSLPQGQHPKDGGSGFFQLYDSD